MSLILDGQPMMELEVGDEHEDEEITLVVNQVSSIAKRIPII